MHFHFQVVFTCVFVWFIVHVFLRLLMKLLIVGSCSEGVWLLAIFPVHLLQSRSSNITIYGNFALKTHTTFSECVTLIGVTFPAQTSEIVSNFKTTFYQCIPHMQISLVCYSTWSNLNLIQSKPFYFKKHILTLNFLKFSLSGFLYKVILIHGGNSIV